MRFPMRFGSVLASLASLAVLLPLVGQSQPVARSREFPPGSVARLTDLPASRLRSRLEGLPLAAQQHALGVLRRFHFTELDLSSLSADPDGGVFYEDHFPNPPDGEVMAAEPEPVVGEAAVPVVPFLPSLRWHSKPGAPAVLFLNFSGETVTGTAWNNSLARNQIVAVPFSSDADYTTFSDAEQLIMWRIWQRVAEDFAPFEIDVTTERPATLDARTAHAVITRNTDANNSANPSSTSGGVAYVDVFGRSNYGSFRPAWIYSNNLGNSESSIAEAVSHEIGHNLGLSHDGQIDGAEYYSGHGSGATSWGPIMGSCYRRNVTQWSKGEYYLANNTQDDLAIISAKIPYRTDEDAGSAASARPLLVSGGTNVISTTPENDPANINPLNKGVLQGNADADVFSVSTGDGTIRLSVHPWIMPAGILGGNLDVLLELRDQAGTLLATNNSSTQTVAQIQTALPRGTYYLYVRNSGVGTPLSASPSGYTSYGSIGQYFVSGFVAAQSSGAASVQLTATPNNAAWGSVTPSAGAYSAGTMVQLLATPAAGYHFVGWTNGASGSSNPIRLAVTDNLSVVATFAETMTLAHPTPYWWLADHGYTNNLESAVEAIGQNGLPLWQSYVAGLNPTDPNSHLRLSLAKGPDGRADILSWNAVSGRLYTVWAGTNVALPLAPLTGASNLPASVHGFTNTQPPAAIGVFYRLEVRKP